MRSQDEGHQTKKKPVKVATRAKAQRGRATGVARRLDVPAPPATNAGPIALALDLIDEDPNQPRKLFDLASLAEMAETIRIRGVKTPISVRPNPQAKGRYLINHGARRY